MQLLLKYDKSTCQIYCEKNFGKYDFNWKLTYMIPHIAIHETKIRIFQYKGSFKKCIRWGGEGGIIEKRTKMKEGILACVYVHFFKKKL